MVPASHVGAPARADQFPLSRDGEARLLLITRIGDRSFALPARGVERILWMAALTPLPDSPPDVVGVLNLQGAILSVVDPRPRLGLPTPGLHPDQRLVVMSAGARYALWVDEVERIASVRPNDCDAVEGGAERALAPFIVRQDGAAIPVLSPEALDPGAIVRMTGGSAP
jgi:purine-binding chemotaxis protein CheW